MTLTLRALRGGTFLIAVAIMCGACGRPRTIEPRQDQILEFATLYAENCAGCHGADGRGGVAQPLNDSLYLSLAGESRIREVVNRGVASTPMPAFGRERGGMLTDAQVDAITTGVMRWSMGARPTDALPPYSAEESRQRGVDDGDPRRGRDVFRAYCARCHGESGDGGRDAGSVVDPAFLMLTSDQALRTRIIVGRRDVGAPGWRDYLPGHPLQDQDISDVVAWLAAHRGNHE